MMFDLMNIYMCLHMMKQYKILTPDSYEKPAFTIPNSKACLYHSWIKFDIKCCPQFIGIVEDCTTAG